MLDVKKWMAKVTEALKVDYIIAKGTNGDWSYRKWNSGRIEAWASHSFGSQSGTSWASQYYKDLTYSLPSGLFSTAPMVIASSGNTSWAVYGASASTSSISLRAVRNASNAASMTINFYCIEN